MESEPQDISVDDQGRNALHWAVLRDDVDALKEALEEGVDISACTNSGDTGLHFAAWNNREYTLPVLLENKADASVRNNNGNTPFDNAMRKRHWGCAMRLLEAWAPDTGVDKKKKNACHYFAEALRGTSAASPNIKVMFELLPAEGWGMPDQDRVTALSLLSEGLRAQLYAARLEESWEIPTTGTQARPRM